MNQYQRRERRRRQQLNQALAYVLTAALFAGAYLLSRPMLDNIAYQRVIDSNGALSLSSVQTQLLIDWFLPGLIAYMVISLILAQVLNLLTRRRKHFDFGGKPAAPAPGSSPGYQPDPANLSPGEFERYIAWLINQRTGHNTRVIGGGGDSGVDVEVYNGDNELIGVVQCKRYDPKKALPPQFVRELATVRDMYKVKFAYLATTAYFTRDSEALAKRLDVRLIDGADLKRISRAGQRVTDR